MSLLKSEMLKNTDLTELVEDMTSDMLKNMPIFYQIGSERSAQIENNIGFVAKDRLIKMKPGASPKRYSMSQLFEYAKVIFEYKEYKGVPFPMVWVTDELFQLVEGWKLHPNTFQRLSQLPFVYMQKAPKTGEFYTQFVGFAGGSQIRVIGKEQMRKTRKDLASGSILYANEILNVILPPDTSRAYFNIWHNDMEYISRLLDPQDGMLLMVEQTPQMQVPLSTTSNKLYLGNEAGGDPRYIQNYFGPGSYGKAIDTYRDVAKMMKEELARVTAFPDDPKFKKKMKEDLIKAEMDLLKETYGKSTIDYEGTYAYDAKPTDETEITRQPENPKKKEKPDWLKNNKKPKTSGKRDIQL